MSRRLAAVACLGLALGLAGCGGGDEKTAAGRSATAAAPASSPREVARYRGQVARAAAQFAQAGQQLRDSVGARSSAEQAASALQAFQGRVRAAATALGRLDPPPAVAGAQRQLAAAFRAIAAACQPSIDAGRAGDGRRFQAARRRLQAGLNGALGARARAAATRIDAGLASG